MSSSDTGGRFYDGGKIERVCVLPPFSFFELFDKLTEGHGHSNALHSFFSHMRALGAVSAIERVLDTSRGELCEHDKFVQLVTERRVESAAVQLVFFSVDCRVCSLAEIREDALLGYAIVKKTSLYDERGEQPCSIAHLYEAVVKTVPSDRCFIHASKNFIVPIGGSTYSIHGVYFASQDDGLSCVCAHVTIRMAYAHSTGKKITYAQIFDALNLPLEELTEAGKDGIRRLKGLAPTQVRDALKELGIETVMRQYDKEFGEEFEGLESGFTWTGEHPICHEIYAAVESMDPAIVFFMWDTAQKDLDEAAVLDDQAAVDERSLIGHVLLAVGHSYQPFPWDPTAKFVYPGFLPAHVSKMDYISSIRYVDSFFVMDDNLGALQAFPRKALTERHETTKRLRSVGVIRKSHGAAATTEYEVPPLVAEALACEALGRVFSLLNAPNKRALFWWNLLHRAAPQAGKPGKTCVFRTFAAHKRRLQDHLDALSDWEARGLGKKAMAEIRRSLSKDCLYWVTEFSLSDIYSANKRKLGEFVMQASVDKGEIDALIKSIEQELKESDVSQDKANSGESEIERAVSILGREIFWWFLETHHFSYIRLPGGLLRLCGADLTSDGGPLWAPTVTELSGHSAMLEFSASSG